jgi:hypothetical protein
MQKGGENPAHLSFSELFSRYTMVTEKSRPLSAMAQIKLANFCMFHSFFCAAQPDWPGRPFEGILYIFVMPPK